MKKNGRRTIAFITNYFGNDLINHKIWTGIHTAAADFDLNCICLTANPRNTPFGTARMGNALYNLVTKDNFDGIVLWGGGLWAHTSPEDATSIYSRLSSFPMVSISIPYMDLPTISVDNYPGMYELCRHMIIKHKCSRIAFIRGPVIHAEAETRYQAYRDCLRDNNIAFDESLVTVGDFQQPSGATAVRTLLNERKCSFDALISASDYMLLGAIAELEQQGISIPGDLKVAGFDDIEEGLIQNAPLTTVNQPFTKMGYTAVELLVKKMDGQEVPDMTILESELIIRQSCGCLDPLSFPELLYQNVFDIHTSTGSDILTNEDMMDELNNEYPVEGKILKDLSIDTGALIDSFLKNLSGDYSVSFHKILLEEMQKLQNISHIQTFVHFLSAIKTITFNCSKNEKQVQQKILLLIQLAHTAICQYHVKTANKQFVSNNFRHELLEELGRNFLATFKTENLLQIITDIFQRFEIRCFYLSLYKNPEKNLESCRLLLAYHDQPLEIKAGKSEYRMEEIIPDEYLPGNDRYTFIVIPLYYEYRQLGFFVFGREFLKGSIYTELQTHLSVALQSSLLISEKEMFLANQEKRARLLQQAAGKLKESNRELQSFAYSASHDLKEPLRKIKIFSERLHMDYASAVDEKGLDMLSRMESAADRMLELLSNLLAYSQITTKANPFRTIDLNEIIKEVLADLEVFIEQEKAEVRYSDLPSIDADPVQIRQLLQNLINNAIKFQAEGAKPLVEISAGSIKKDLVEYCCLKVSDNGIGIKKEYIGKIFGIFQRLHSAKEYKGTGIGLAICKRVVERHYGSISVESTFGKGTTFTIMLPVTQLKDEH
ncbi:MAG: substrate-binding domain-containing protein [Spirochaetales bacterium]|nr:substrate-binding domain-containing protein [Spirochaetales bacterium]